MEKPWVFNDLQTLRKNYSHFYHCLNSFVKSIDTNIRWYFKDCYDPEFDGSKFSITYATHSDSTKLLCITAYQDKGNYEFEYFIKKLDA